MLVAAAIVAFMTTRRNPTVNAAMPVADTSAPNRFFPTLERQTPAGLTAPEGMVWIPGGEFSMGAQDPGMNDAVGMQATTDSRPVHRVYVDGFWMDATEVTNAQFAAFVKATGYVTFAEQKPRAEDFPGAPPESLVPGSVVFTPPAHVVPLNDALSMVVGSAAERVGVTPSVRRARSMGRSAFRWCTSPSPTRLRTRNGPASACRRKRSGSSRHVAGLSGKLFPWGDEFTERWPLAGEYASRSFSRSRHRRGSLRRDRTGRTVSAEWLRAL